MPDSVIVNSLLPLILVLSLLALSLSLIEGVVLTWVRRRSLREIAGTLFGPPGWRADGQGSVTEDLRRAAGLTTAALDPMTKLASGPQP